MHSVPRRGDEPFAVASYQMLEEDVESLYDIARGDEWEGYPAQELIPVRIGCHEGDRGSEAWSDVAKAEYRMVHEGVQAIEELWSIG